MKYPFLLILAFFSLLSTNAAAQEMNFFEGTWDEVMAKAKAENKPVLVDFWAPWCGPCRIMNAKTFTDKDVAELSNHQFIAYKLNTDSGEGPRKSRDYKINGIPCIMFFNAKGEEVHRAVGYHTKEQFLPQMQTALKKAGVKLQGDAKMPWNSAKPSNISTFPQEKDALMQQYARAVVGEQMMTLLAEAHELGRSHNEFDLFAVKKK